MAALVDIPADQLWGTWPSGVIPEKFASAAFYRIWPQEDEPVHLIHVGILLQERNLLPLSEAVERAHLEGMRFVLSLVGDGPERPALEEFARNAEGRVRVHPPVPHDQVPRVLSEAHVGVTSLPSSDNIKYEASSPIKLFEYMAAGLPVLAIRNACHEDVVGEGGYVFWVEEPSVDDLLAALRSIWVSRVCLPLKGRQAAAAGLEWTWESAARKLKAALEVGLARQ
jgi:glycosyltransferase involved in cell wall biosynthesis